MADSDKSKVYSKSNSAGSKITPLESIKDLFYDWKTINNKSLIGESSYLKSWAALASIYLVGIPVAFGLIYPASFIYHGIRSLSRLIKGKPIIDSQPWPHPVALEPVNIEKSRIPFEKRKFDIVLFGATGFTGALSAKYIAKQYGNSIKWAIAGRNKLSLEKVRDDLALINKDLASLPLIVAKSDDLASLDEMVKDTRVVLTTVGPFTWYGTELVKSAVENGTSYCDVSGEVDWSTVLIDRFDSAARKTEACIVNMSALYCVPWDMLTLKCAEYMKSKSDEELSEIHFYNELNAGPSGGTLATLVASLPPKIYKSPIRDFSPYDMDAEGNHSIYRTSNNTQIVPGYSKIHGKFSSYFMMTLAEYNCIRRSNALNGYGKNLIFRESEIVASLPVLLLKYLALPVVAGILALPPLRDKILLKPGDGPSETQLKNGFLQVTCIGKGSKGTKVMGRIYFNADPAFQETSRILVEAGLSIALNRDKLKCGPNGGGVLTPATCQGSILLERLIATGTKFEMKEIE